MTTDNTTPRLVDALTAARNALDRAIPRLPTVIRRLDQEQPGWPTGHTSTGRQDGPDRFQTDDTAMKALAALLRAVDAVSRETALLDHQTARWSTSYATSHLPDTTSSLWCVSCLRVGSMNPRRSQGGDLCRWCMDTLRAVNHHRRTTHAGAPLAELPTAAVLRHARGERTRDIDIDQWSRGEKVKR
jgi:hypothetical protein